jgi:peptidoglycan hydrolase-like protein with peptidoglycan-binding domain
MGMRVLMLVLSALSILGVLVSADAARANLSMTTRIWSASAESAPPADEATQAPQEIQATPETEGQLRLDNRKRRDVQRRLTSLGFDAKANGKFDEQTRAAITRWQEARGYPQTGYFNTQQYDALRTEFVSTAQANSGGARSSGSGVRHHRSSGGATGGPVRLIGGVVGGLFGHR